jgi:hypothetical protein
MQQKCADICWQIEYIIKKTILKLICFIRYMLNCSAAFFYIVAHFPSHSQILNSTSTVLHRKKNIREFPVPSRDVTTKFSLGGNNDVITELFLPRGSLVSDIPAGDGKLVNLFYGVWDKGSLENKDETYQRSCLPTGNSVGGCTQTPQSYLTK